MFLENQELNNIKLSGTRTHHRESKVWKELSQKLRVSSGCMTYSFLTHYFGKKLSNLYIISDSRVLEVETCIFKEMEKGNV